MSLDVLYLDNHLLVVNKPPGMLTQRDRTGDPDLLSQAKGFIQEAYDKPGPVYLGLVHRLDRPASGVLVMARTSKAARRLARQFKEHFPDKRYLAIVEGTCEGWGTCVDYLVKEEQHVRVVKPSYPNAKRAELRWQAVAQQNGLSLLEVRLHTGRPHQIRVQLAQRGYSILGDLRYGATQELDGRNLALHSYRLTVEHPTQRDVMTWQAPPPPAWNNWFRREIDDLLAGG